MCGVKQKGGWAQPSLLFHLVFGCSVLLITLHTSRITLGCEIAKSDDLTPSFIIVAVVGRIYNFKVVGNPVAVDV